MNALQQIALVDALTMHWDAIRMRLGPVSPALNSLLDSIGTRLMVARSAGDVARALDDLLELARGTAAAEYVRDLVSRANVESAETWRGADAFRIDAAGRSSTSGESLALVSDGARLLARTLADRTPTESFLRVPVLYATNRRFAEPSQPNYLGEISDQTTVGTAMVTIPGRHRTGVLESRPWWNRFPDARNADKYFVLSEVVKMEPAKFAASLESASAAAEANELLVFLHGYNVSFEDAALRSAQFANDSGFRGVVVLFSWPSAGSMKSYAGDEARASASADPLAQFLKSLEKGPWSQVHVLAHSMGNRVMLGALADNERPLLPVGQIVFAAADVYLPEFRTKFPKAIAKGPLSATSYASRSDWALRLSNALHGGDDRLGLLTETPFEAAGLETIDATAVSGGGLAHGYWSSEQPLLSDLRVLLLDGKRARDRQLEPEGPYWAFKK